MTWTLVVIVFVAGLCAGVIVGVFVTSLCVAAARADRQIETIIARDTGVVP